MQTADFNYSLPPDRIAQKPAVQRDASRLLILHRSSGAIEHRKFVDLLDYLHGGDVLVLNNSRVLRARLHGQDIQTRRKFEMLLLEENATNDWWAMMKPGKYAPIGKKIGLINNHGLPTKVLARVMETNASGHRRLNFEGVTDLLSSLEEFGQVPLPPYIARDDNTRVTEDTERYQTVFATATGSVAAPTAGLHFTDELLDKIRARGVKVCFVTLHVGVATFAPVKSDRIEDHQMHEERFEISDETKRVIHESKRAGARIVAVGTTTVRVLETVAACKDEAKPLSEIAADTSVAQAAEWNFPGAISGRTKIFIYPPCQFRIVDALLTNFHLPRSTLLMLVSAFGAPGDTSGRDIVLKAYAEAIRSGYRFFSYGDAMLIL